MGIRRLLAGLSWLLLLGFATPAATLETLSIYDNFQAASGLINPLKWTGGTFETMEVIRSIVPGPTAGDQELRLDARTYGFRTLPGAGQARNGNNRMKFRRANLDAVRAMRATVKVNSATAVDCPTAGAEITQARWRMGGFFFNAGAAEPFRGTDDVAARIEVRLFSNAPVNQLNVRGIVFRCLDPDCFLAETLFNQTLATVLVGETHTYLIQWDPATNQFRFRLDALPVVTFVYALADSLPAQNAFDNKKAMELNHFVANCQVVQTQAFMSVNIDDVFLNTAAATAPALPQGLHLAAPEASARSADEGRIPGEPEILEPDE